jgi:DDE_Tnp_1-associated
VCRIRDSAAKCCNRWTRCCLCPSWQCGSETITDIARFCEKKLELLRGFRPFRDGTPSHDHLGDILATLDAEQFQRRFVAWVAALTGMSSDVIAIDGKTWRRSKKGAQEAIDMVSTFVARSAEPN